MRVPRGCYKRRLCEVLFCRTHMTAPFVYVAVQTSEQTVFESLSRSEFPCKCRHAGKVFYVGCLWPPSTLAPAQMFQVSGTGSGGLCAALPGSAATARRAIARPACGRHCAGTRRSPNDGESFWCTLPRVSIRIFSVEVCRGVPRIWFSNVARTARPRTPPLEFRLHCSVSASITWQFVGPRPRGWRDRPGPPWSVLERRSVDRAAGDGWGDLSPFPSVPGPRTPPVLDPSG